MIVRRTAWLLPVVVALAMMLGVGCRSDDTPSFPKVVSLGTGEIFPTILNSGLAVGQNRVGKKFLVGYLERELAQAQLDGDLPSRGVTDPLGIRLVFNHASRPRAEMCAAFEEPQQRVSIEEEPHFM